MKNIFFEIRKNALEVVDVTIFKAQNSIILILKFGKLGRVEYVDKGVFTALTYLGFQLQQKVSKYI